MAKQTKYRIYKGCDLWLKRHTCEECPYVETCAEYKPEKETESFSVSLK